MSLDFALRFGGQDIFCRNITHNCNKHAKLSGCYEELWGSHGKSATEILPALRKALIWCESNMEALSAADDPTWGRAADFIDFLSDVTQKCTIYSYCIVSIRK